MSAYMCSERELTILAAYAVKHCLDAVPYELRSEIDSYGFERSRGGHDRTVGRVFTVLAIENLRSLEHRYPSGMSAEAHAPSYEPNANARKEVLPALHIIKLCHHYAYQACEHPGWESSAARELIAAVESHAVRALPGYAEAPWGVS